MNLKDKVVLSNGVEMPNIGFGTWQMANDKNTEDVLTFALTHGYSHIDTAMAYGNEEQVGKAIKNSNRKREELFSFVLIAASGDQILKRTSVST